MNGNDSTIRENECSNNRRWIWKSVAVLFFVLTAAYALFEVISHSGPLTLVAAPGKSKIGEDFSLRWNEAWCVREGINPYLVWSNEIEHPKFYGNDKDYLRTETRCEGIGVYPPWEYCMMLPLTFVSRETAWQIYHSAIVLALVFIVVFAFLYGWKIAGRWEDGLFCSAAAISTGVAIQTAVYTGNYPLPCTMALLCMAWCLQKRQDVLAGLCWAFIMIKPQQGLLLAVPLLIGRRYLVVLVSAVVCLAASVLPAILCRASFIDLILQPTKGNLSGFKGCALMPRSLFAWLTGGVGVDVWVLLYCALFLGAVVCIWLTWRVRRCENWLVLLAPATICSMCWTYCPQYGWCMCCVVALLLAEDIVRTQSFGRAIFCAMTMFLVSQGVDFVCMYMSLFSIGRDLQPFVASLVDWCSLLGLAFFAFWCNRIAHE